MPWIRVADFDSAGGALGDLPPQAVPPNLFTDLNNVRFVDGALEKAAGMAKQYGTVPIAPYYLLSGQDNSGNVKLFIAGLAKLYTYWAGSYTDVTRVTGGDYAATANNDWTGGVLHGIPFLNNGVDVPQSYDSVSAKFQDLPNWTAGVTAKSVRAFKNFLVAMDVTKSSVRYPHNVLWSHPADPGTVPSSWNTADTSKDAGEHPLSETSGYLIDGAPIGNLFALYKEDATHLMQYVGGQFIFNFRLVARESGILTRNCIAEVSGKHIILTKDDMVAFDGQQIQSIANRKWRRSLFNAMQLSDYHKSFVVALPAQNEVWFCIPTTADNPPDTAFVWNWSNNSWSKRELPFAQSIAWALPPEPAGADWSGDSATWDSDAEPWSSFIARGKVGVLASPKTTELFTLGIGELLDDQLMNSWAEHESWDGASAEKPDIADTVKHISKLRPRVIAANGTVLRFEIGTQMFLNDPIDWGVAQYFTVGTDDELCMARNGRYISWRITSTCDCTWRLEALDFLAQIGGRF